MFLGIRSKKEQGMWECRMFDASRILSYKNLNHDNFKRLEIELDNKGVFTSESFNMVISNIIEITIPGIIFALHTLSHMKKADWKIIEENYKKDPDSGWYQSSNSLKQYANEAEKYFFSAMSVFPDAVISAIRKHYPISIEGEDLTAFALNRFEQLGGVMPKASENSKDQEKDSEV